jgi:hypothetical protein
LAQKLYEAALKSEFAHMFINPSIFDRSEPHTGRYKDVLPSTGGLRVIYDLKINTFVMTRPRGDGGLRVHVVCQRL